MNKCMNQEICDSYPKVHLAVFTRSVYLPSMGVASVENQTENEADDLKFLSMGQKGKHWLRECEKWALFCKERINAKPREQSKMLANHRSGTALTDCLSLQIGRVFSQLTFPIQFPGGAHSLGKILGHTYQRQNGLFSGAVRFYDLRPLMETSKFSRRKMMACSKECVLFQAICFWRESSNCSSDNSLCLYGFSNRIALILRTN